MNKETTMIKIDKGHALPVTSGKGVPRYPWRDMAPGDSFFVANASTSNSAFSGRFTAHTGKKAVPGSTWTTRTVTENGIRGIRVWRLT